METPRSESEQASAISNLVVQTCVEHLGRGPTRARTTIARDLVVVVLDDGLTRPEKSLVAAGHLAEVITTRRSLSSVMAPAMIAGVEAITGREVLAFLSDNHLDPDISVETFVLRSIGGGPQPHARYESKGHVAPR